MTPTGDESSPMTTTPGPRPPRGGPPAWLVRWLRALEDDPRLDAPADVLAGALDATLPEPTAEALRGRWAGHTIHPILTDIPIGAWTGANILDLVGGRGARGTATGFMALGLASALPAAASGLAEWRSAQGATRRVGVVHAALNIAAIGVYAGSLAARLRGRHGAGVVLGLAGTAVATAAGYLGGHLATVHRFGTVDPALRRPPSPAAAPPGAPPA